MKTSNTQPYLYNISKNISDFLFEFLNDTTHLNNEKWSYETQQIENPKITFLEQRIAALEGGVSALAVKSFNKAKYAIIKSLVKPGENIVTFNSYSLYHKDKERLNRAGVEVRISEDGQLSTFNKLIDENTKIIYLETISPEYLNIPDFQKIKFIAKTWNIPIVVDNTAGAAGYVTRPILNGANIVIEKTIQWLPSHKGLIGAVIVDGGNYDWFNGKFPQLINELSFLQVNKTIKKADKGVISFSLTNYFKKEGNINVSNQSIPQDPFSLIHDFDHLNSTVQRQSDNAKKIFNYLKGIDSVASIQYTGSPENPSYFKATTFFRNAFGAYLSFSFKKNTEFERLKNHLTSKDNKLKEYIKLDNNKVFILTPSKDYPEVEEDLNLFFSEVIAQEFFYREFKELNSLEIIF